jgi:ABC-2 type transport system permease protein
VLTGRSFADTIYQTGILSVLMVSGLAVGWGVHTSIPEFLLGVLLLVAFAFAMSWIGIWLGLSVPTVEVAQQVAFVTIFPITFISSAFVPIQTMPDWLQPFAEWNPVSTLTSSLRILWGNPNPTMFQTGNLPSQYPLLITLGWFVVLLAIFMPLGVRKYRSTSR